jgi:hypothetical protein
MQLRFTQLSKQPEVMERIQADGVDAALEPRPEGDPRLFGEADARSGRESPPPMRAPLRAQGLSDLDILDLTHGGRDVAWANRLMQTLGEPAAPAPAEIRCDARHLPARHRRLGAHVRAADRELRVGRLSAGRARPAGLRRPHAGRGDELRGARRRRRVHHRADRAGEAGAGRPLDGRHGGADHAAAAADDYRAAVLSCTSPAFGNPAGDFQKKFVADRLAPLDAGAPWPISRRTRRRHDGPNADPAGRALFIEQYARAGGDLPRGGAVPRDLRRARQPAAIKVPVLCLAAEHDRNAPPVCWKRWRRKFPARATSACPASATCRTSKRRRLSMRRSSTS